MNNIFQKNIQALAQKNSALANRLNSYIPNDLPKLVQENGAYNIIYKGVHIHNENNPLGEAQEIFSMTTNEPVSIHLVYGLGLGYLFQMVVSKSIGTIILYEPDLNILWFAFNFVDFTNDILKNNVYITDNLKDTSAEIYKKSNTINTPQLLSLPSVRKLDNDGFERIVKELLEIVGSYSLDLKFTKEKFYPSLKMLIQNLPNLINEPPLISLKDICKEKTAVVVSAGPTLDRDIDVLKKYRDKFILISVGTAVKTLYSNGLKPDFLCIIETYNSSRQVEGLDLSDVCLITEPYSNPELRNFKYKKIYSHSSANSPVNHIWADLSGENIEEYWTKGTVSYTALNSARILGCSKIILVGQDLAYIEGQCYSKDSAYKDLCCTYNESKKKWEITAKDFEAFSAAISSSEDKGTRIATANRRLERLNNSLYYVKGINGDMIPTESVYAAFVKPLSEFAQHYSGIDYINASLLGAQIDRFKNMPLEEALLNSEDVSDVSFNTDFKYDLKNIVQNIKNNITALNDTVKLLQDGQQKAKNLLNDLKRLKNIDEKILTTLKKVTLIYLNLSDEVSKKCNLYDVINASSKIDLDYEMKMMTEFNFKTVLRIIDKISDYFSETECHVHEIMSMLNEVLDESFNTKS